MAVNTDQWKGNFKALANSRRAIFTLSKSPSVGYGADFVSCSLAIPFRDTKIIVSQSGISGNNEIELSFLVFECTLKNQLPFYLSLYRIDFFDKFFSQKRFKTGIPVFDSTFGIKTNIERIALSIFRDSSIQNFFLSNPNIVFNISSEKDVTVFLKSLVKKMYSQEEFTLLLEKFYHIISIIIDCYQE